jgi:hypothetical protein
MLNRLHYSLRVLVRGDSVMTPVRSADRAPLPITETGFKSAFIAEAVIEAWGGPAAYVRGWLDAFAREPEWIERGVRAEQLTLF